MRDTGESQQVVSSGTSECQEALKKAKARKSSASREWTVRLASSTIVLRGSEL